MKKSLITLYLKTLYCVSKNKIHELRSTDIRNFSFFFSDKGTGLPFTNIGYVVEEINEETNKITDMVITSVYKNIASSRAFTSKYYYDPKHEFKRFIKYKMGILEGKN